MGKRRFRKVPVVVDAEQWFPDSNDHVLVNDGDCLYGAVCIKRDTGTFRDARGILADGATDENPDEPHIHTLEGFHEVTPGDWIIRGVKGEHYPCKPDIFAATYEAVDDCSSRPCERCGGFYANTCERCRGPERLEAAIERRMRENITARPERDPARGFAMFEYPLEILTLITEVRRLREALGRLVLRIDEYRVDPCVGANIGCASEDDLRAALREVRSLLSHKKETEPKKRAGAVMDYPTAWAFVRGTTPEQHHPDCSWRTTSGAILCDCHIVNDEYDRRVPAPENEGGGSAG